MADQLERLLMERGIASVAADIAATGAATADRHAALSTHAELKWGGQPLTEREEWIWLAHQQGADARYQHALAFQLCGEIEVGRLTTALYAALQKMPELNASYRFDDDAELRKYVDIELASAVSIRRVETRDEAVRAIVSQQSRPWNLECEPPLRFVLLLNGASAVVLGVFMHRIIADSLPWQMVLASVSRLYNDGAAASHAVASAYRQWRAVEVDTSWRQPNQLAAEPLPVAWLRRPAAVRDLAVTYCGRSAGLDSDLSVAWRYGVTVEAAPFLRLMRAPFDAAALLAVTAVLVGRYLAALGGQLSIKIHVPVVVEASVDLNASISASRLVALTVRNDGTAITEAVERAVTDLQRAKFALAGGEVAPGVLVMSLVDAAEDLSLQAIQVERIPLPSPSPAADIAIAVRRAGSDSVAIELMAGRGLSSAAGPLLLERFVAFVRGETAAMPAAFDMAGATPLAPIPATGIETDQQRMARTILEEFRQALSAPDMQPDEDFFDRGGHSLTATRVIGRLLTLHRIEVHFNDLFSHPSAAALAQRARACSELDAPEEDSEATVPEAAAVAPLSLAQKSLWKIYAAFDFNEIFNIPFALRFLNAIDERVFEQALLDVMKRHAGLRTLFRETQGDVVQQVVSVEQLQNYRWFWTSHETSAAELRNEAGYRFDLARELPLRIRFSRDATSDQQILSLLFHHIALDEWSVNLLVEELEYAYMHRAAGEMPVWKSQPAPFHEFAVKQHRGGMNSAHLDYWVEKLRGAPKGGPLFGDRSAVAAVDAASADATGGWVEFKLDRTVSDGLYALAKRSSASLFNVVYAGIALSLHALATLDELVIGTSASGRNDAGFFDTIGYFTTVVAHRVRFDGEMTLLGLIEQVRNGINESMPFTDIPLDLVEEALGTEPGREHMFEVFIQLHAKNKLNGSFALRDGRRIEFRQIDPDKSESLLGLQFEVMDDIVDGQSNMRVMMSYRSDHYGPAEVDLIATTTSELLSLFAGASDLNEPIASYAVLLREKRLSLTVDGRIS